MLTVGMDSCAWEEQVALLRSGVDEFGFAGVQQALNPPVLRDLQLEATAARDAAVPVDVDGDLRFRARMGKLGAVARRFLTGGETAALLEASFGERFVLAEDASCFTYYSAGDSLGLHRDRSAVCRVTLIVYLECVRSDVRNVETGLVLKVYGHEKPGGDPPRVVIPTTVGGVVVGRGADAWHERPPLQEGESVVALTACFGSCGDLSSGTGSP